MHTHARPDTSVFELLPGQWRCDLRRLTFLRCLFVTVSYLEQPEVIERFPDELDSNRQVVFRITCGHYDAGKASGRNNTAAANRARVASTGGARGARNVFRKRRGRGILNNKRV